MQLPGDRLFRMRGKTVVDPSGIANTPRFYDDRIARYFLYLMGHPINEMEYAHWAVNGDGFTVREMHEPIANDFLDRVWDNGSEGTLRYSMASGDRLEGARRGEPCLREIPVPAEEAGGWRVEAEFVGAIRGDEPVRFTDFATGVRYMEFTEAVARSAREGVAVTVGSAPQ